MLEHFSGQLPWPRMISTGSTRGEQRQVDDKDRAMLYYQAALGEDCRISGYGQGQTNPDLLFIDLDAATFASKRAFKLALTTTLNKIQSELGGHPTVLWSGRGYHIIQPIDCPRPLEEIKELAALEPYHTSNKFLQFAERYLSANRCDSGHHPAIKSCMLRIPGSINSKCKELGLDPQIRLLQRWDGCRPDYRLLIGDFHAYLAGKVTHRFSIASTIVEHAAANDNDIAWIDRLLQTPIRDWRKTAVALILAPYLITIKRLSYELAYNMIMQWASKCAELSYLRPNIQSFIDRIHISLTRAKERGQRPMRWTTLVQDYSDMYAAFKAAGVVV
jgi:hypothetical protein